MNLQHLRAIHGSLGTSSSTETKRFKAIHSIAKDYNKALSVEHFLKWELGSLTNCSVDLNVYSREFSTVIGHKLEFTCLINTCIDTGTIIYDPIDEIYWLAMYVSRVDRLHKKGILYRCNWQLKWQDTHGNVWEYPACDINSTQYNSGIDQGRNVDYVTSQHKLTTTSDINTNILPIDKRFFLGKNNVVPEVYRITQNDSSSQNYGLGLVSLTMLRDVYSEETDDIEQMLCDIYPKTPAHTSSGLSLDFIEPATIRIGSKKTVKATSEKSIVDWQILEQNMSQYVVLTPTDDGYGCIVSIPISDGVLLIQNQQFTLRFISEDQTVGTQTFTIVLGGG